MGARVALIMATLAWCQPAHADVPLPGVDTKDLDGDEKKLLVQILEDQFDPCGKPQSFLKAVQAEGTCPLATKLGNFVVGQLQRGLSKSQVVRALLAEIKRVSSKFTFTLVGRPSIGPEGAKVTVVAFSDYQCPHCRIAAKKMVELCKKNGVRLVYKQYPLEFHPAAKIAAQVAIAAHFQGKYWTVHEKLFADQDKLDESLIDKIAKASGVDLVKAKADADKAKKLVEEDRKEGDVAGVDGTPTIYINGVRTEYEDLESAIDQALKTK